MNTTETDRTGRPATGPRSDPAGVPSSSCAESRPHRSPYIPLVCAPPRRPANTLGEHLADRVLPTGVGQWIFFAAVAVGISVAPHLPIQAGLLLDAVVTLAASGWCLINFYRCREAHCVVSGYGWAALGLFEIVELVLGRSVISGDEGGIFVAILIAGLVFECGWQAHSGSNALIRTGSDAPK